jgi:hypothetical protein
MRTTRTVVDDIAERLRNSPLSQYRDATYVGFHHGCSDYPVLVPDEMRESGIWVLGGARSGKTQRVIASLMVQSIARNYRPAVILDLKGDDVLKNTAELEAARWGRELWLYSNIARFGTRLFNPLDQEQLDNMSRSSITELFINAMNLFHGFGYGEGYFTGQSVAAFSEAIITHDNRGGWAPSKKATRARSFVQLERRIVEVMKRRSELRGAEALVMVVRQLANVFALNGGCCDLYPASAVAAGIQIPRLLCRDSNGRYPVLYCYLRSESEPFSSSITAKLFLNLIKSALRQRMDDYLLGVIQEPPPLVDVFNDECHNIMDSATQNMLEQGASMGLRFVLANQDVSQLKSGRRDYFPTVWENCGIKIILSSRDNTFQELLMKLSGEKAIHHLSYFVEGMRVGRGQVSPEYAFDGMYQISEMPGPRFERNHLIEMSAHPGRALFIPAQNEPLAKYNGYPILIDIPFLHSRETFERLKRMPWTSGPETVVPHDYMDRWEEILDKQRQ